MMTTATSCSGEPRLAGLGLSQSGAGREVVWLAVWSTDVRAPAWSREEPGLTVDSLACLTP